MKRFLLLLSITMALSFAMSAQPVVKSGTATATLAAAGTSYIYPLNSNGDTITFGSLGVLVTTQTIDSLSGTGNGTLELQYSETLANDNWSTITTSTITLSATDTDRTTTSPFCERRIRWKYTQTTTGGTRATVDYCYMNTPW